MRKIVKTYTLSQCLDAMAAYAKAFEETGGKNIIFCEDRLTLLAERALLRATGGTFSSEVATFARFLHEDKRALSKQGSVMAVGEVMTVLQREKKLQCFSSTSSVGNNARCIYETLAQFSASEITPELLREGLEQLPNDMLKKKLSDLAWIYEGYETFLSERGFVDESKYLSLLPKRIRDEGCLRGYNVFFLGYTSFTAQARETVRAALETADNVVGIFCAGDEPMYANRAVRAFEKVCAEFGKTSVQTGGKPLADEAERLRKGLFEPVRKELPVETDWIALFEGEDKTTECEYVATKIRREMAENPALRFRDITVLTSDVAGYALPLKKAFAEYGIPYFVDEKRSLRAHPLSRFLLDAFRTVREGFSPIATQALCSNAFFGDGDGYRNYLLKYANYRGGAKRPIKTDENVRAQYDIGYLEESRNKFLTCVENIKSKGQGREYCAAVRKILVDFQAEEKLERLAADVDDVAQKGFLSQIYRALDSTLAEAELLTGGKELTLAEFEAILRDGLDATQISLIPLKTDAVFVGDVTDSRVENAEILFALGMTDAVPRTAGDTALISDKEIEKLAEVKAQLEPTLAEVNMRTRESVCLNLCSFKEKLYLSYPLSADGSEPSLSEIFRDIDGLFCSRNGGKLPRKKKFDGEDFVYRSSALAPALRQLLESKRAYEERRTNSSTAYSSLYTALDKLSVTEKDDYLCAGREREELTRGEALFFKDGRVSPTALESYFDCPFRHFAERGLKLKEREETAVMAVDSGNFVHELLERTLGKAETFQTEEEARAFAKETAKEILEKPVYRMQKDTRSGAYFTEKLLNEGVEVAAAAYRQLCNSDFHVDALEKRVRGAFFQGKADRVDVSDGYVRVVDYKTGAIDDKAEAYYTGRKMQMQLYMTEVQGERIPAGVFYFPASLDYVSEDEGRFRMKGFINGDPSALRCGDKGITAEKKSEYFAASLKNPPQAKRIMDEETFRSFIDYSVLVARSGYEELKKGYIEATPYRSSCTYCPYGGMCGFCKDTTEERKESKIDPKMIANIAKKTKEGEA